MYDSEETGLVGAEGKAERVADATIKALGKNGELLQNRLINVVAEGLKDLDPHTVNGLVRKFLIRYSARSRSGGLSRRGVRTRSGGGMVLVKLREEEEPRKRRYWKLTAGGWDYLFLKVRLHEFSKAITKQAQKETMKSAPEEYEDLVPFFYAISESEELAKKVEAVVWGMKSMSYWNERWYAATIGSWGPGITQVQFPRGIWHLADLRLTLAFSVTRILAEDEGIRAKVGPDVCEKVGTVATQLFEPIAKMVTEFDRHARGLKDDLEKESRRDANQ